MQENRDDLFLVGYIGVSLLASLFFLSAYRTAVALPLVSYPHPKFVFHISLTACLFMETFYYLGFALEGSFTRWAQVIRAISLLLYLLAYSTVILLWSKTLTFRSKPNPVPKYCVMGILAIHCISALLVIGGLCASSGYDDFNDNYKSLTISFVFIQSMSFFLLALGMLMYGVKLQCNLRDNTMWLQSEPSKKLMILVKINTLLLVCTLCYALRVATMATYFMDIINDTSRVDNSSTIVWFTLSQWVPMLLPVGLFLHFMRVKDSRRDTMTTDAKDASVASRPRQTEDDNEERVSEVSNVDSERIYNSEVSENIQGENIMKLRHSEINRISFKTENSDFFTDTMSPLQGQRYIDSTHDEI